MDNIITANELRAGHEILYSLFGDAEPIALLVCEVREHNDALSDWYDNDKADTLDALGGDRISVITTTLDGCDEHYLLLSANEPIALLK